MKHTWVCAVIAPALTLIMPGCGGKAKYEPQAAVRSAAFDIDSMEAPAETAAADDAVEEGGYAQAAERGRKLITTGRLTLRVENPDKASVGLTALMEQYGAYSSSLRIQDNARTYTLRIPCDGYRPFLDELMRAGKVVEYSENIEDVTLRYYDLESRLNTRRELLRTYQGYLGKAKTMEDLLSAEAKIADLQAEIEAAGTRFRNLAHSIDYSTIHLELLGPPASNRAGRETLGDRVAQLAANFGGYVSIVLTVLFGAVIYGIPSFAVLLALYWLLFGKIGAARRLWRLVSGRN